MTPRTIVAVGAHMDDVYFGAGPVLARAARAGHRVVIATVASDFASWSATAARQEETRRDILALADRWGFEQVFFDYPYHQIVADVALKQRIAGLIEDAQADVVFAQNPDDHWPDHREVGIATKDAALFRHGLSDNLSAAMTPLVFAYAAAPNQTIRFEPDTFLDVTSDMGEYMAMLAECDHCLSGRPTEELLTREVVLLREGSGSGPTRLRVSGHGWVRLNQCALWGCTRYRPYALALRKLWSRDAQGDTLAWFHDKWPNLR